MDSTHADGNLSNNDSEINNELDNKICVYETIVSEAYIKQESCYMESEPGDIYKYVDIKDEIIEDPTVLTQETKFATDTKENYLMCCDECGENYDLYCFQCPMLIRILNSNNPNSNDNRVRRTLPKNFVDICETTIGIAVVALRAIPKGVVFGPFEGLDSSKDDAVSKWKLKNKELPYIKDPKQLNWMQHIRRVDQDSHRNLTAFQYNDGLYYRSDCHICVNDELLVCWNSGTEECGIQDVEHIYWKPQVCERLDDTYACTLCCIGYKSICHLAAHNSRCPEKESQKDFCKEIIQCVFCKIYLNQKEYLDYHIHRCCECNPKKYVAASRSPEDTDKPELKDKYKCSMCEYSTSRNNMMKQHQLKHTDLLRYKCPDCPYRACKKYSMQQHVRTHVNCHQKKRHSVTVYKCGKCFFETMTARNLRRHQVTHQDAKSNRYKCPKCNFATIYPGSIKTHLLNIHGGVKRFKCPRCIFKTYSKQHLDRHLRYHADAKPINCETCDKKFWTTKLLIRHQKEVHAITETTFGCPKCEYRTSRPYVLKQHLVRVHDGPKLFGCTLCPYKTTANSNLKRHIAARHDDKPFACNLCSYKAMTNSDLKRHVVIHNDDKPFVCTLCSYKTAIKSALTRHVAIHNDDKPFKCDMCPQMFKLKSYMTKHARTMHSQTQKVDYKCPQ